MRFVRIDRLLALEKKGAQKGFVGGAVERPGKYFAIWWRQRVEKLGNGLNTLSVTVSDGGSFVTGHMEFG
jgi:hypothetical protein